MGRDQAEYQKGTARRLITENASCQSFDEHLFGSIEAGKLADMVVLEEDVLSAPPETITDLTIVDGKVVYRREGA